MGTTEKPLYKTRQRVELKRLHALVVLDAMVTRIRWYERRAIDLPEELWNAFNVLCIELGFDANHIRTIEGNSKTQVWLWAKNVQK